MKYKIYSSKNQGNYRKDELLYVMNESQFLLNFGKVDYKKVDFDGVSFVYVKFE